MSDLAQLPRDMTTTQAAEFLDVSRPFVIKLTQRGELPCRMVGKHRRIPSEAVVAYRETMFQRARNAADEMVSDQQEGDWLDTTFLRYLETQADESVTLEQVRSALAKIPGSMVPDFYRERDERS